MKFSIHSKSLLIFSAVISISLSSCFISRKTDMDVFQKKEYVGKYEVKTIKVPMLLAKPIVKKALKKEDDVPKELISLISQFKKIKVTIAQTANQNLVADFRNAVNNFIGDEWVSVRNNKQLVYLKAQQDAGETIRKMNVAVSDPESGQMVLVDIKCKLTVNQLSDLINYAINEDGGKSLTKNLLMKKKVEE